MEVTLNVNSSEHEIENALYFNAQFFPRDFIAILRNCKLSKEQKIDFLDRLLYALSVSARVLHRLMMTSFFYQRLSFSRMIWRRLSTNLFELDSSTMMSTKLSDLQCNWKLLISAT